MKQFKIMIASILVIIAIGLVGCEYIPELKDLQIQQVEGAVSFSKCVDGDTFWLYIDGVNTKIRLSGVNTPESTNKTEPYGKEASSYTCQRIQEANEILVEYDTTQDDSYDRKVAIIFLDGRNFNLELVEVGFADLKYLKDSMPYAADYRAALIEAQAAGVGRWKE
ncbi:thermonuclease family protein [Culicoidibacter larvae]|uniref:Thermonuclease family protein n=1 Tax=Culicoidibacter larvae TaxID=2579976 RepID=A0A5R8Q787_9FIRM|nr:thermonuclease family protein [Culicoidibacter larvae]TLG71292.1 thermonuclease family protein [Culicoidibacter larvae]